MKFCEMLEGSLAPPLSTPGPGGNDATLHGRQDARRYGRPNLSLTREGRGT